MKDEVKFHISFHDEIKQICTPLEGLGINSFNFVRTYNNGSQINLCNSPNWLEYFYENKFYEIGNFENHPENYLNGFTLWKLIKNQEIFYDAKTIFNIDNGITLTEKGKDYCEFYFFGTAPENESMQLFFMENTDLLKRFSLYFKEKADKIIKKVEKNKILIPNHFDNKIIVTKIDYQNEIKDFLDKTKISKYIFSLHGKEICLSAKEMDCLALMLKGNTLIEIGENLFISPKTAEAHINKIKAKIGCKNKGELMNFFYTQPIHSFR